ncbi:hypothetical protein [Streptomyces sp. DH7]|uniref:hypothetical protein n=1 Tax=Streptomyces sp. DH7 TaxID=2857006 RepID=UPI001E3AA5C6|nr:hypothetical protein [Streptomyces sp. DH7]
MTDDPDQRRSKKFGDPLRVEQARLGGVVRMSVTVAADRKNSAVLGMAWWSKAHHRTWSRSAP